MKKFLSFLTAFSIVLSTAVSIKMPVLAEENEQNVIIPEVTKELKLYYDEEAPYTNDDASENPGSNVNDGWERWSIPLGNGYFGANVFGRTQTERIQLTEKTLSNPYYKTVQGETKSLGGLNNFSETYIDFNHTNADVTNYRRELDLKTAVSTVSYDYNNVNYTREYFVSYPDKAMVIKLESSKKGALSFTLRPTIPYIQDYAVAEGDGASKHGTVVADEDGSILLSGHMGYFNIDFEGQYRVIPTGGSMSFSNITNEEGNADGGTISVENADSAYIIITIGTNYELNSNIFLESDPKLKLSAGTVSAHDKVSGYMSEASKYTYEQLKERHISDYGSYFGRVSLDLGGEVPSCTTDELLNSYKAGQYSQYLEELYFQYGRYLLLASSREDTLPANLQGTWNRYNFSPWSSGFWHNINVQMNYWPAFNTNLAETFEAYVNFNKAYMPAAERYATDMVSRYNPSMLGADGGNGWCIGTGANPYEITSSRSAGNVGFTTKIYWDYYDFTRDENLLKNKVYPVISSGAKYITKAVELNDEGVYVTSHSDSPEQYVNGAWYYTKGSTYDQSFAYENNNDTKKAAEILNISKTDDTILSTIDEQIDKYDPIQIGYSGQVKEFREENYYGEYGEYNHRHISQLVGLYPGTVINSNTPAWLDGAIVTLTERGDKATGWGMAHRLNLWARTKKGNRTYQILQQLLKTGTATNLWDLHPPFQIDGNLGGTAGIAEMLLQSHEGYIAPLSAIPDAWSTGSYTGLCARGNFEVSAAWENGSAKTFNIKSKGGNVCRVGYSGIENASVTTADGTPVNFTSDAKDRITFDTVAGEKYIIYNLGEKEEVLPVSDLTVKSDSRYNYHLSWSASADAVSYNVYKAFENASDYTLIGNTSETSFDYQISESEDNGRMTYRVCALSASGQESDGTLCYVNPVTLTVKDALAVVFNQNSMQVTIESEDSCDTYRLYGKEAESEEYTLVSESKYPCIITEGYDENLTYAVSIAQGYYESDKYVLDGIKTDEKPEEPKSYENILLGKTFIKDSGSGCISGYDVDKLTDGSFANKTGRFALNDSANSYAVLSCDLGGSYELGKMKIYDFLEASETHTRCDETTIEVFYNNEWTTVFEKQPLDYDGTAHSELNKKYTEFDLSGKIASKIRITAANTSGEAKGVSLLEIEMSAKDYISSYSDNLLLGKPFTGTSSTGVNNNGETDANGRHYGFECLTDGDYGVHTGRFAARDAAYSTVVASCDLNGIYTLENLTIDDHKGGDEPVSRSNETTVEVFYDGVWTKIIDKLPLENDMSTTWNLGGVKASQLRITFANTSGNAKGISIYEILCSGNKTDEEVLVEESTNILLDTPDEKLTFVNKGKPSGTYGAVNAFDGDLSTRWAVSDSMGAYSVIIDLASEYKLKTMQIYDFRNAGSDKVDGVLATRSDKTSVELYSDGVWKTVISEQPLTIEQSYTLFDLGFNPASKIKITFNNTKFSNSASIYEITCTAAKQKFADRSALLEAVKMAENIDASGLSNAERAAVKEAIDGAVNVMQKTSSTQEQIDEKAKTLGAINDLIASGDTDVLISETNIYKGDTEIKYVSSTDDVEGTYNVSGLGGKRADDVVYKLSGTPASSGAGKNYFGTHITAKQNYTMEFNFMLGSDNAGFYVNTGFWEADGETQINPVILTASKNGFNVNKNDAIKTESLGKLADCEVGKWYKIAVVAPYNELGNDAVYVYINGEKFEIKLTKPYYSQRHGRVAMIQSNSAAEIYYDNVYMYYSDEITYNPNRDKLNILSSGADGGVSINGQIIDAKQKIITVGELKEQTNSDIRVYRNGYSTLLSDDDKLENGDTVVAFAKNLKDYERTYNYYTVSNVMKILNSDFSAEAVGGSIYNETDGELWGSKKAGEYAQNKTFILRADADDSNKVFMYWKDVNSGMILSYQNTYELTVGTGKSIMAVFADNSLGSKYITFKNANGMVLASGYQSGGVVVPSNPYVGGYVFDGWYLNGEKQNISAGDVVGEVSEHSEFKAGYKLDETLYTITLTGANEEDGKYRYNTKITVTPKAEVGKTFTAWKKNGIVVSYSESYSFYVNENASVEAVYDEVTKEAAVVIMSTPVIVAGNKLAFFAERNVKDEYRVIESGILLHTNSDISLENYTHKAVSASSANAGQFTVRKANVSAGDTWYGRAYVIYTDGTDVYTVYSNEVSKTVTEN